MNLDVNVRHVARVEGHGNIVVNVKDGRLESCRFEIVEAPRFFEGMLKGRTWREAHHITCRICGICSVGHTSASLRATEDALGIEPSPLTRHLRRAILDAEIIQSHALHVYFLAAPDFFGAPSVIPLVGSHPEIVQRALRLKRLANDACAVIGGRHIHPVSMVPGGFSRIPSERDLADLLQRLEEARTDVEATVETFARIPLPDLVRPTEYLALGGHDGGPYPLLDGDVLVSTLGDRIPVRAYREKVREYPVAHSTAKHVHGGHGAYMVGALARFEVNGRLLHPRARLAAEALGLTPRSYNTFKNNLAQVVEIVHCLEDAIVNITAAFEGGLDEEPVRPGDVRPRAGRGVGAVEVPRGTLFHEYEFDDDGVIVAANCVIPTGQNLHHVEKDMEALIPSALALGDERKATQLFEMLIRAYDPCISCSTHMLSVAFRDGEAVRRYGAAAREAET